jgi:hypothetical protein
MSIGALSISEAPIAAQSGSNSNVKNPPPKRTIVATADPVAQPEPR